MAESTISRERPYTLHTGWAVAKLRDLVAKPQYGLTASATRKPLGPRFVRITDIQNDEVIWSSVPYCECHESDRARYAVEQGDLLVARIGATTGKTCIVRTQVDAVFASYLIRIRTKPALDPEYLYYFTKSDHYWAQINANKGGRLKGGINLGVLADLEIPLPPLVEQRTIASTLWAVQQTREATEKVIIAIRELKHSLMRYLFAYGPSPVDQAEALAVEDKGVGPMPVSWQIARIDDVATVGSGGTPDRSRPEYWGGSIPWIKTGEINYRTVAGADEHITELGLSQSAARIVRRGAILMAMYGQGVTRGRVAILGIDAALNQACAAIEPSALIDPHFLFHWLTYRYEDIRALAHGANQKNLNAGMIRQLKVPLPPIEEQQRIVQALDAVDRKLWAESERRQAIAEMFDSLLEELMTGKRRVVATETVNA